MTTHAKLSMRVKRTFGFNGLILLTTGIAMTLAVPTGSALSSQPAQPQNPTVPVKFPDGITPSHVFARLDLLDRCVDKLLSVQNLALPEFRTMERQLGPLHVYQMMLACSQRVQILNEQENVLAVPTMSAKPKTYDPRDVLLVVDLMVDGIRRVAAKQQLQDLPVDERVVSGKTPTDVFARSISVFLKLNALCGYDDISPSEVYAEMVRAGADVRSILRQADPECRYRVDAPSSEPDRTPTDVFTKCLDIRRVLNDHRTALQEPMVPVPELSAKLELEPQDVFVQTQIIIAELNFLKLKLHTVSSTPLAIPVKQKTPTDVHQEASLNEYLLGQIMTGTAVVENSLHQPETAAP